MTKSKRNERHRKSQLMSKLQFVSEHLDNDLVGREWLICSRNTIGPDDDMCGGGLDDIFDGLDDDVAGVGGS